MTTIFRDGFPSSMLKQSTSLEPRARQLGKSSSPACSKENPAWLPRVGIRLQCHVGAMFMWVLEVLTPVLMIPCRALFTLILTLLDPHIRLYL